MQKENTNREPVIPVQPKNPWNPQAAERLLAVAQTYLENAEKLCAYPDDTVSQWAKQIASAARELEE